MDPHSYFVQETERIPLPAAAKSCYYQRTPSLPPPPKKTCNKLRKHETEDRGACFRQGLFFAFGGLIVVGSLPSRDRTAKGARLIYCGTLPPPYFRPSHHRKRKQHNTTCTPTPPPARAPHTTSCYLWYHCHFTRKGQRKGATKDGRNARAGRKPGSKNNHAQSFKHPKKKVHGRAPARVGAHENNTTPSTKNLANRHPTHRPKFHTPSPPVTFRKHLTACG